MGKMIIRSFEEDNKRRKMLRRIFLLISVPFFIIIILFGAKVLVMTTHATESVNSFNEGDFAASTLAAAKQKENNFLQPWLAYYNSGTAIVGEEEYELGIEDLTKALDLVGDKIAQCQVRANLAIAYEKYGDEFTKNENTVDAEVQYALALEVIEQAPSDCFPPNSGDSMSDKKDSLEGTGERVESKQEKGDDPVTPEEGDGETKPEEKTPEEKIEEQLKQSNDDRQSNEAEERGSENGSTTPADKPW